MKLTILMLGGSRRVSMAKLLKESGKRLGYDVEIVAYELETRVPIALEGEVIAGMKFSDPNVVDDIARIVKEKDVKIILPFVNSAIEIASLCKERFEGVFVPVADFATTSRMFDKSEAARLFKEAGFPIPRTYSVIDNEMPAIVKPRKGGSSRGIKIFHDVEDLMLLQDLDKYFIQEYIEHNKEYSVDCYISAEGEILATVPRERLEVMGGEVNRTKTNRNPHLIEMSRKVIEHFKLTGPVTIQFLHDLDRDRYLLMEVNPRLGGGVICSIYAGAPIPDYIIQEALSQKVTPTTQWADGVLMTRYQSEAIFYC
ncbi:MAG: ATP-grasp domain-containing protein [Muribaculaceae bacterium]|nr:ATP-grasp domain-containing protein [Muribaculaceae bacterium]